MLRYDGMLAQLLPLVRADRRLPPPVHVLHAARGPARIRSSWPSAAFAPAYQLRQERLPVAVQLVHAPDEVQPPHALGRREAVARRLREEEVVRSSSRPVVSKPSIVGAVLVSIIPR